MNKLLKGKIAIITGANQGLGLAIATNYVAEGASVVLCARNSILLNEAKEQIAKKIQTHDGQFIEAIVADVSNPDDVLKVVTRTLDRGNGIDILVNNAGIYGPMGSIEKVDWQDWIQALQINIQGSVLMARAVLTTMKQQRSGKIIQLSGGGATNPMPMFSAYAVSKAAVVRFAETLAIEVQEFGIDVNAIAPGALNTGMLEQVLVAGPEKTGQVFYDRAVQQKESGGAGLACGTALAVFLASELSNGITGKLISALWDNWEQWPQYIDDLLKSDAYTLRRITGRDRALAWGDK